MLKVAVPKMSGGRDCERGAWCLGMSVSVGERTGTRRRIEREKDEVSYGGRGLRDGWLSISISIIYSGVQLAVKSPKSRHWLVTWCGQWDGGITFFMKYWWGRGRGRGIGTGVPAHSQRQQIKNELIDLVQAIRKKQGTLPGQDDARYFRERTLTTCVVPGKSRLRFGEMDAVWSPRKIERYHFIRSTESS